MLKTQKVDSFLIGNKLFNKIEGAIGNTLSQKY